METSRAPSVETAQIIHEFSDVFIGIGCFRGTFLYRSKKDVKPYQVPPRCMGTCASRTFKKELEGLHEHKILVPLHVDNGTKWCNSFVIFPKHNGILHLSLDPTRLNQVLIKPVYRGPTLHDILPKLKDVYYMMIPDTWSGY